MKISANWLRTYINTDADAETIADKLTLLGLEVEEVTKLGSDFKKFVVGEIKQVKEHPNADRLQICEVFTGNDTRNIVCGAKNVAAGQKVAVANEGAVIPTPMPDGSYLTIRKMKIRGETSIGMICSEAELGISDNHSGILVLDEKLKPGTPLKDVLGGDVDHIFEIGLTPNRPDAACHIGVARDLSAVTDAKFETPYNGIPPAKKDLSDQVEIIIEDEEKCHRYAGFLVKDVIIEESPNWLKSRLESIGLRPVNNVVDVTNYILHETGQPLHAFDADKIKGNKIVVKSFEKEVAFKTLDHTERKVPADTLFICDGSGPVAIAGVMGGEDSEVTDETKNILIESAYFDPSSIRKASKQLALQTDSSYRFERGIDPTMQVRAAARAAELIAELAGGTIEEGYTDLNPVKHQPLSVDLRVSRVNHLLGTKLNKPDVIKTLEALEFAVTEKDDDTLTCTVPPFRPDVTREVDLIEEVGRVFDYNNIPTPDTSPSVTPEVLSDWEVFTERIRNAAKSLGFREISTNSLLSKKEASLLAAEEKQIDTLNPVSQDNTTLRSSLAGGFLKTSAYNLNRKQDQLRFFEIGHVFEKDKNGTWVDGVKEHCNLLIGVCGYRNRETWLGKPEEYTVFDLKADLEALLLQLGIEDHVDRNAESNRKLAYSIKGTKIAELTIPEKDLVKGFDMEAPAFIAEFDLTALFNTGLVTSDQVYRLIPKFPCFEFDAAFTVDSSVKAGELSDEIRKTAGSTLINIDVFDVYEGENIGDQKKSIAFRLTFLDSNKTLTIKDVEPVVQKVVQALDKKFDAKLRS